MGETLDYNDLLQPISEESATGIYLKSDRATYRTLRNSFNAAQSSFRRLTETPESSNDEELFEENLNNWQAVNEACWGTLTEQSKDIEIYCWWVMSLAFQDNSIDKISQALTTLVEFIKAFWPDVQPYLPEEKLKTTTEEEQTKERAELQLRPLIQLLGESSNSGLLFMPLQMMSLVGEIDHAQYFSANKAGTLAALKEQAQADFGNYKQAITADIHALAAALSALDELDNWLKETSSSFNIANISAQFLKANINDNLQAIKYLVSDCYSAWPLDTQQEEPQPAASPTETKQVAAVTQDVQQNITEPQPSQAQVNTQVQLSAPTITSAQINNRDNAFAELRKIADYFAKAEPHSPVSYLLEKAIRWGYTPLPELMTELVAGNEQLLAQINLVTGLNSEKESIKTPVQENHSTQGKDSVITDSTSANSRQNQSKTTENTQTNDTTNMPPESEFSW